MSSLQTDYINLDSSSDFGRNIERANTVQKKCTLCGGSNHSAENISKVLYRKSKKARAAGDSDNRRTEFTPRKCFICGSEDHLIIKFPKAPKDN